MSEIQGYSAFARYYDSLTGNVDYPGRAARLDAIIRKYKTTDGKLLLDLACGTGSMCEALAKRGYDVLGVDCSPEMLGCAMEKKLTSGLPIQYLCQDMRRLDMFGTIDVTICLLDSLNHLSGLADVEQTFARVSLFAEPDGLFLCDMNTPYKHKTVLGDSCIALENEQVLCVWQNHCDGTDVDIQLDFFEQEHERDGTLYRRSSEHIRERAYETDVIDAALVRAGFAVLAHFDGERDTPVRDDTERILYVCRKIKEN